MRNIILHISFTLLSFVLILPSTAQVKFKFKFTPTQENEPLHIEGSQLDSLHLIKPLAKTSFRFGKDAQEQAMDRSKSVAMLLQGDTAEIKNLVTQAGGFYKYAIGNIASVKLSVNQLSTIINNNAIKKVEAYPPKLTPLADSVLRNNNVIPAHNGVSPLVTSYDGTDVVIGIIDGAMDFNHGDFKTAGGKSRVLWIWDQSATTGGTTPATFGYGQEWTNAEIDAGTCNYDPSQPANWYGHGTHVAGVAASNGLANGKAKGSAPGADLIFCTQDVSMVDAVNYVYSKAAALGKPCVINASLGNQFGMHDGRDLESQSISALIDARVGQSFVAAAGNEGDYGDVHLAYTVSPTDTNFTMFSPISGNVFLLIAGDTSDLKDVEFSIGADKMSPIHEFRGDIGFQKVSDLTTDAVVSIPLIVNTNQIGLVQYYLEIINGNYSLQYFVTPDSTAYNWRLMAKGSGSFDLWNYNSANSTYTPIVGEPLPSLATMPDSANYKFPDANKTIAAGFQNLDNVIAVGSYVNRTKFTSCGGGIQDNGLTSGDKQSSSSIGPTRDGRIKPDIMSASATVLAAMEASTLAALIGSGSSKVGEGCMHTNAGATSNASPGVAGAVALYLQQNPTATTAQIKQAVIDNGLEDNVTGATPNNSWGYGRVDAYAMLTGIVDSITTHPLDVTICENLDTSFTIVATGINLTYQWQVDNGGGYANLTNTPPYSAVTTNTLVVSSAPASISGYKYRCIVYNDRKAKELYSESGTITINGGPTITLNAYADSICVSTTPSNTNLDYSGTTNSPTNYDIDWDAAALGEGFVNIDNGILPASPILVAVPANALSTTFTGTLTVENASGCTSSGDVFTLTVDSLATATAGGTASLCSNTSALISGANATGGTIAWTEDGAGSITSGATTLTPTYTAALGDAGMAVTLTMTVTGNNSCLASSAEATYTLNVESLPTATAGGSSTICSNAAAVVSGASASGGTPLWTENGAGSITSGGTTLTPTYTANALDEGNTVVLTMTVTSTNSCFPANAMATYSVIVDPLPVATAGGSQTICTTGAATVSGASSANGSIAWSESGFGSITAGGTSLTPTYTPALADAGNAVVLVMTVTSTNSCTPTSSSANYTVNVDALPTSSAGGSSTICSNASAVVSGTSSSNGSILWTDDGAGSITSGATTLTPTYTAASADEGATVTLTMTVTSTNTCAPTSASSTYSVVVEALPTATAGGSSTICSNSTATVSGASSAEGTILWTDNGAGSITAGSTSLTPTYTAAFADGGSSVILTMTVTSTNSCAPQTTTAQYTVNVDALPVTSVIGSATICSNASETVTTATANNGGIMWTHNGSGTLTNPTTINPTYTATSIDEGNDVILTMTVTSTNSCSPATSVITYTISVDPLPTAVAGGNATICSNTSATVSGATASNGSILWSENGEGTITAGGNTLAPTYTASGLDEGNTVILTMTTTGTNSCSPQTAIATYSVYVDPLPTAAAGGSQTICANQTATIDGVTYNNGTIAWSENGFGSITSDSTTTTPVYSADEKDGNGIVVLTMTVSSTNTCSPATASATYTVIVDSLPTVSFTGLWPSYCFNADPVNLTGSPSGGTFSGNGITDMVTGTFSAIHAGSGIHEIGYTFINGNNCSNDSALSTIVLPEPLEIDSCTSYDVSGNGFTPNGDGINDYLCLDFKGPKHLYTGDNLGNFSFFIYDRWGTEVFSSKSPKVCWGGKNPAGQEVRSGTYFYVLNMFGKKTTGFITVNK